jgi:hypothetical protein
MSHEADEIPQDAANDAPARVNNPLGNAPVVARPTGAAAVAHLGRGVAELQTMMLVARLPDNRRNEREAIDKIINACSRPGLADSALYQYARGGTNIEGPSIRLAEAIAQCWGNIDSGVTELSRTGGVSEVMAYAIDLETGYRDSKVFQVKHWRDTQSGGYALSDSRDIYELVANMGARRKRACMLAVIPGDIVDIAVRQINVTLSSDNKMTPERIKKMVEAFAEIGVTEAQIVARIQRSLDALLEAPALAVNLGKIYNSIRDGMSKPADWFQPDEAEGEAQAEQKGTAAGVKDKLRSRAGAKPVAE